MRPNQKPWLKIIAIFMSVVTAHSALGQASGVNVSIDSQLRPEGTSPKSASEYYTTRKSAPILVPINVWGEIHTPGVYYLVPGSSIHESISAAGGPTGLASMPDIRLLRNGKISYIDLLGEDAGMPIQEKDTLIVERSWARADLPPLLGVISAILGIVSVSIAISKK